MELASILLDSWDRQARIVCAVAGRIDESNRFAKPSEDGWRLDRQLSHIHHTRKFWLSQIDPERAAKVSDVVRDEEHNPTGDLESIRKCLDESAAAVRECVADGIDKGVGKVGGYDNPVYFLQHMLWHEGWHVGLIFLGLRLAGQEPPEEWEEANVWGEWRVEEVAR